nr:immunoglobulin heavy chain junction region [Macaca mulatta]MOX41525.1 immunoglobulin heavy chain junction region [Macaca mulatta]
CVRIPYYSVDYW